MRSQILQLRAALDAGQKTAAGLLDASLRAAHGAAHTNFMLALNADAEADAARADAGVKPASALLAGIPYMLKDNVSTAGTITTGGSAFLKNYVPPFDATLYAKLKAAGAVLVAKTNMDEFGLGGTGTFSAFGDVLHPLDRARAAGGSSSGSAVAVACGSVPFAVGTDTGDSIRRPASLCGVVGYKPTYGRISRFGVFPYAPSLDTVGAFATCVADAAIAVDAMSGFDENDYSSRASSGSLLAGLRRPADRAWRLAYPENLEPLMHKRVAPAWARLKAVLAESGCELVPVQADMGLLHAIDPTYKIVSYAEAVSCYASFTGIPFGAHLDGKTYEQVASAARDALFGAQLKRRFTIGSFALKRENYEKYYLKSQSVRTLLNRHLESLLHGVDAVVSLGASDVAQTTAAIKAGKAPTDLVDDFLQLANFAGAPSITLPFAKDAAGLGVGLNLTAAPGADETLLRAALACERAVDAKGYANV